MFYRISSLCFGFAAALLLTGCVTNESPKSSLTINSPLQTVTTPETGVAFAALPMEGPAPQDRPDILSLASGATSGASTGASTGIQVASADPAQMQAMLEPQSQPAVLAPEPAITPKAQPVIATNNERNCLMRTMYFESNRSSPDGLLAVGTVVMHRLEHGAWGNSVCSVVQAKNQFAPGLMTRKMQGNLSDLELLADQILAGKRHPKLAKNVMFFHVAGMKFPYKNMRYVHVAGGNTFYYKAQRKRRA